MTEEVQGRFKSRPRICLVAGVAEIIGSHFRNVREGLEGRNRLRRA